MAVPDTDTFSLNDVVLEVLPTTDDLVDCFADAEAIKFDPSHEGSKNNLLNFRNYNGGVSVTAFTLNTTSFSTSGGACGDSGGSATKWHDGAGGVPVVGDKIFTDAGGFNVFDGGSQWFKQVSSNAAFQIFSSGAVSTIVAC